jgi:hypothetical protein
MTLEQASALPGENDLEKIRRILFKNTTDMSFSKQLDGKVESNISKLRTRYTKPSLSNSENIKTF